MKQLVRLPCCPDITILLRLSFCILYFNNNASDHAKIFSYLKRFLCILYFRQKIYFRETMILMRYFLLNLGLTYSVPLTEEEIFAQVMAAVNKQLQRKMRMPTRKRKSLGKTVIRKLIGRSSNIASKGTHTIYFSSSLYIINQKPMIHRTDFHCTTTWVARSSE